MLGVFVRSFRLSGIKALKPHHQTGCCRLRRGRLSYFAPVHCTGTPSTKFMNRTLNPPNRDRVTYSRTYCTENTEELSERAYEELADETLEQLTEKFEDIGETLKCDPDFDVSYGSGVLTVTISQEWGTYVINKQTPNKQIWLSSPKRLDQGGSACEKVWYFITEGKGGSDAFEHMEVRAIVVESGEEPETINHLFGPKRYDFIGDKWIYRHDGQTLQSLLNAEISQAFGEELNFDEALNISR